MKSTKSCHYCNKKAVREGSCSRAKNIGVLPVCGRHFYLIDKKNSVNIGTTRVKKAA